MDGWDDGYGGRGGARGHLGLLVFVGAALASVAVFWGLYPQITAANSGSPLLINAMFLPAAAIGFLYGAKIAGRAVSPGEARSPLRRAISKTFLFFFVIGGMFSSVSFALNGGSVLPDGAALEDGLVAWATKFISANGGATFLIVSSIALMAAATRRIVGMDEGVIGRTVAFVGTFIFFTMLFLSFTGSDPTSSGVYLYTFYHAGIVGGAFYAMNRLTRNQSMMEDYANGY
ncbi:MAG: hypothetical protein MPI95_07160 [Nitrosopumilus sp.]|nr:hypothetical protein [Nitrosopumilus sp.]MDA7941228.1 hypothetical protein [Nitrosopumilus sp.]MDA7942638.1 hypothetical protein [Nitrosopumilus sp.]MDA7945218.1 hypothetical protein [Nitrosopumilus sp.]MDA7953185.1 hypothetical protein [Nitrosopumilus sp.]